MNLGQFIGTFKDAIARRMVESFPPLYWPSENGGKMPRLLRKPLGAQADAIRGAALSLEAHRGTTVVGEMGTGKTFIAAAAAHMAGFRRILVLCPPHLVPKWKREVEMTVPGARAVIVKSITDLEWLRISVGSGPLFAVMSREKAKLSYRWMPAVIQRWAVSKGRLVRDEETGEPFRVPCCPDCTAQIVDKDGVPLTDEDLNRRKHTCAGCGGPLWQADKSGPARYPLADYVKHHMKGFFDLLVGDEVHEYKGRGSAQSIAAGVLADVCGKSLSLSGTLMGGYSSTLFHLLYRFSPELRTDFERSDEHRWIQRYGFEGVTVGKDDDDAVEDGRNSRRRKFRKVVRERPGLVPSALFHIIGNTVFLRLADVASGLPDYDEQILLSSMDSEEDATGYSQRSAYNAVYEELRLKLAEALKAGSKRLLATYLQTLLAYPEGCTKGETVFDPRSEDVIVQVPPLSEDKLYPKEKALVDLVAAERMEGRRVLVYATHTGTRDITERMDDILTRHGFPGGGDEGRRRCPRTAGGVGGGQGERGHRRDDLPPQAGADRPRPHRLPDPLLVRDRVLRLPINTKRYGSHGQSIWMQLRLNRWQQPAELRTSQLWWINEQVCRPSCGFKPSQVGHAALYYKPLSGWSSYREARFANLLVSVLWVNRNRPHAYYKLLRGFPAFREKSALQCNQCRGLQPHTPRGSVFATVKRLSGRAQHRSYPDGASQAFRPSPMALPFL